MDKNRDFHSLIKINERKTLWIFAGWLFLVVAVSFLYPALSVIEIPAVLGTLFVSLFLSGSLALMANIAFGVQRVETITRISLISFVMFFGIDVLYPPLVVNQDGTITQVALSNYATDVAVAQLWSYLVPTTTVYTFTYIVTPFILIFLLPSVVLSTTRIKKLLKDIG